MEQDLEELEEQVKRQADYIAEMESAIDSFESDINDIASLLEGVEAKLDVFWKIRERFHRGK